MKTVCSWIGNSERIAAEHSLQVTDEHYDRATDSAKMQRSDAASCNLDGNERQQAAAALSGSEENAGKSCDLPLDADDCRPANWAMRDSNPRHPRCKRGALAN